MRKIIILLFLFANFVLAANWTKIQTSTGMATLDMAHKNNNITLSNADLTATSSANDSSVYSTLAKNTSYQIEVTIISGDSSSAKTLISLASSNTNINNINGLPGYYNYASHGYKYIDGSAAIAYGTSYGTGDKIGVSYNASSGAITFFKNGVSQGIAATVAPGTQLYFALKLDAGMAATVNFGSLGFAYPMSNYLGL